ncbi:Cellulase [Caenorhabditis elegans]|uniref:Cellulase n=1 Tax=Caenorhabditis elegans TaxID=6239 RepID=Q9NAK8_CAEEL|nr:Cellulase [Caenorhabditis elegans]CAB54393.2 Cellulase [Caenorhabditis elegans]
MAWNFKTEFPGISSQISWYNAMKLYNNYALKPILFAGNDSTADYSGETWRDACYHRFYAQPDALYVAYWLVENDMYCEVLRKITPRIPVIPSFEVQYLTRVESLGDGCAI